MVDPRSVLLVTLDSCRYDTFIAADAPNLKNVGEQVHAAQAPSHFTYGSHMAMFVGFTPGIAGAPTPYLNPKYSKFFRIANKGRLAFGPAAFELEGRTIAEGFGALGYRTVGSGALSWFDPETPLGRTLTLGFERFFFSGGLWKIEEQVNWLLSEIAEADGPVFAFLNVGETHVPYWYQGADWPPLDNPCLPFQEVDRAAECAARQRACLEFVDAAMAPLIETFGSATTVVTSDHGDCWGEDGLWEHAISHPATLTVPLVFRVAADVEADRARRALSGAGHDAADADASPPPGQPSRLTPASRIALRDGLVVSEMGSELVIFDPAGQKRHRAGATGSRIIALLRPGGTPADLVTDLTRLYDIDAQACEKDVLAFLQVLHERRLLEVS